MGHRYGQVDNGFVVGRRLPNVEHGVAYLRRKIGFCARKAFGGVLKGNLAFCGFFIIVAKKPIKKETIEIINVTIFYMFLC